MDGVDQFTYSDHNNVNDDNENVDDERHINDSENEEEERLRRMYRNPDNSGRKRTRNGDGSERNFLYLKYNNTVGEICANYTILEKWMKTMTDSKW